MGKITILDSLTGLRQPTTVKQFFEVNNVAQWQRPSAEELAALQKNVRLIMLTKQYGMENFLANVEHTIADANFEFAQPDKAPSPHELAWMIIDKGLKQLEERNQVQEFKR